MDKKVKIIVTLGPATNTEEDLRKIKDKGVDFVRINMSHSSIEDLRYFIKIAKKVDIPFIIDTEGSQIRTGDLEEKIIHYNEGEIIKIYGNKIIGNKKEICLTPGHILEQLEIGDLLFVDFDTLIIKISDISTIKEGYILARIMTEGNLGNNKAVIVSTGTNKVYHLPVLSEKDKQSINIGLEEGIGHLALSFVRKSQDLDEVRKVTNNAMYIISKVEAEESLHDIDKIIEKSDAVLMDRGDMSKEVPIEKIPLIQKIILKKAKERNTPVYIATNLLESMIVNKKPTRAEVNDVINTILDGASGLILSAETAIGENPMECINMLNKLIEHSKYVDDIENISHHEYLSDNSQTSSLIEPHGGKLVERFIKDIPEHVNSLKKIKLNAEQLMDVEQIAIGTFSPIEGFMGKEDFQSVLDHMKLKNGVVWPLPVTLDVSEEIASQIDLDEIIMLTNDKNEIVATMKVEEKFNYDKEEVISKLYCTDDKNHPGAKIVLNMKPILLGGKINLIKRRESEHKEYELTPKQVRKLFEDRGWVKIMGFHTRNVIHRGHEFIQLDAMKKENCDGLFVHPIIGKKKVGDYNSKYIIKSYEEMMKNIYPKNKVVFSTFSTFSRYAGPREAIFTALCRKNFGCSHFIVGRDHTGVGDYYHPNASHQIFDKFPEIGIKPIKYGKVFYSDKLNHHIHEKDVGDGENGEGYENNEHLEPLHISGTEARKTFESGQVPPEWFMRPEVSSLIVESIKNGEEVFVKEMLKENNKEDYKEERIKDENNNEKGKVIWFTGLSGSGKTTIALELKRKMEESGKKVEILDGDVVRDTLHQNLGFSREDIKENNRLIAKLAKERAVNNDFILVPIISPYKEDRKMVRSIVGDGFLELFINASLEECIKRDVKGLYKKALAGEINNFIGVAESNPYEVPENPELEIDTSMVNAKEGTTEILDILQIK